MLRKTTKSKQAGAIHLVAIGVLALAAAGAVAANFVQTVIVEPSHIGAGTFAEEGNYVFPGESRVGVGTINPESALDINGNLIVRGQITSKQALVLEDKLQMQDGQYITNTGTQRGTAAEGYLYWIDSDNNDEQRYLLDGVRPTGKSNVNRKIDN